VRVGVSDVHVTASLQTSKDVAASILLLQNEGSRYSAK
jgi:hypothetical protein